MQYVCVFWVSKNLDIKEKEPLMADSKGFRSNYVVVNIRIFLN